MSSTPTTLERILLAADPSPLRTLTLSSFTETFLRTLESLLPLD